MKQNKIPKQFVWGVVAICVLPALLNLFGVDFGTPLHPLDVTQAPDMTPQELTDAMHAALEGSNWHTLLEWTAVCIAIFTVFLAFVHFNLTRDVTTPVIGMALFCSGVMDAFHTLAADRMIEAVADNTDLIPFTWAISRLFNALILLGGVGIFLLRKKKEAWGGVRFVISMSAVFGILAYGIIHYAANSSLLPQTMYPGSGITRPYDVAPLVLYALAGLLIFPLFYRQEPSLFAHALVISAIPLVVTQLHMAFGSTALYDNHFNVAHFVKIVAYFVPLLGLSLDYLETYREEARSVARLQEAKRVLDERTEQLISSESKYRDLFENAGDLIQSVRADGSFEYVNPRWLEVMGYTLQEVMQMRFLDVIRPDHHEACGDIFQKLQQGKTAEDFDTVFVTREGTHVLVQGTVSPIMVEGEFVATRGFFRDVTTARQAEEAIRRSEGQLRAMVEEAPNAIVIASLDGHIVQANRAVEQLFGYPVEEVVGQKVEMLLPERYRKDHVGLRNGFATAPASRPMGVGRELFARHKDGSEFPVEISLGSFETAEGQMVAATIIDITERQKIEKMKDEFVSMVSHELRTPLTSIRGALGLLAGGILGKVSRKGSRMMEIAISNTDRLVRLINDILDIERMESGRIKMEREAVALGELVQQSAEVMQAMADKAGVTLQVSTVEEQLWADPDRILQTLTNLLSNAIKFSPEGGVVRITAERRDGEILIEVRDKGRGIPADKIEHIFERFQQVDASDSRDKGGTGLGLAICKSIVLQHGGRIWVESEYGRGSSFFFTLPVLPEQEGERAGSARKMDLAG